jgi:hypothetical protein
MKLKRWRQKAVDRGEWASVILEAKALRGPQSQEVRSKVCREHGEMINAHTV